MIGSLNGERLVITDLGMTATCEPATLMEQDEWLASFLTAGPTVALEGDTLTLTGNASTITLVDDEVAEPDRELEGTLWVLEYLINSPGMPSVPGTPARVHTNHHFHRLGPPVIDWDRGEHA